MSDQKWDNIVIETGVDTLLNYLAENQEATVAQISEDLGVSEKRIKKWAEALDEKGFVEKNYSARQGMLLKYTKQNKEKTETHLKQVKEEVEKHSEEILEDLENKHGKIENARKDLKQMSQKLEENRAKEQNIKENLDELEELQEELEDRLKKEKKKSKEVHSKTLKLISKIDTKMNQIQEAEEQADKFEETEHEIKTKVKALKKLENHVETAEEVEEKLEDLEKEQKNAKSIFTKFWNKIPKISNRKNYEEILDGTVEEVKKNIRDLEPVEYEKLVELEKNRKNRRTLIEWLESRE